jgi:hypothetical protein
MDSVSRLQRLKEDPVHDLSDVRLIVLAVTLTAEGRLSPELGRRFSVPAREARALCRLQSRLNSLGCWWRSRSRLSQPDYSLKGAFIRLLYQLGYATEVKRHHAPREGLRRRRCDGTGQADDGGRIYFGRHGRDGWRDLLAEDLDAGGCCRCGGSSWYRPPD